jgi:hypothetical protein
MTPEDWVSRNRPFYHITPTRNVPSILENGLERRNTLGICVCNCDHPKVIEFVTEMMLVEDDVWDYSVIRIFPTDHNLTANDLAGDDVVEGTNTLHTYILRDSLPIKEGDVVGNYQGLPFGLSNATEAVREINELGVLDDFTITHQRFAQDILG